MHVITIPGSLTLDVEHLVLDVNGTVTDRGALIDGVEESVRRLLDKLDVHLISADTFGSLADVASTLGVPYKIIQEGAERAMFIRELGAPHCVAIGNGANDREMLYEAALGIGVIGPEGAAAATLAAADVICSSIEDALALLLDDRAVSATLRP